MKIFSNLLKVMAVIIFAPITLTGCLSHLTAPVTFFPFLMSVRAINVNMGIVSEGVLGRWELLTWVTYVQLVCMLLLPAGGAIGTVLERWFNPKLKFQRNVPLMWSEFWVIVGIVVVHVALIGGLTWVYLPAVRGVAPYPGVRLQRIPAVFALIWGICVWVILFTHSSGQRRPKSTHRRPPRPQTVNELLRSRLKRPRRP